MADGYSIDIEMSLAAAVRDYLLQRRGQDYRISEDEYLRPVCLVLSRFVQGLLANADGWSRYAWVDDIEPCAADRDSSNGLLLTGLLIWAKGTKSGDLKDPLSASIRLSGSSPTHLIYEIRFGDADRGLGKCAFGSSHDFPYVPVENWLFTFVSGG
jgi:hypothetical protein